jgi:hypothetical protein
VFAVPDPKLATFERPAGAPPDTITAEEFTGWTRVEAFGEELPRIVPGRCLK